MPKSYYSSSPNYITMQIFEPDHTNIFDEDYDHEHRLSNASSCLFPPLITCMDPHRTSLSYDKLPQKPLRLSVLKLDGSVFGIEVCKMGRVGDVKRAVEAVFDHLPKKGSTRISWGHVWGQFCLCHEGHKLLNDDDYVGMFGIRDGDELQFIRHYPSTYNLVRTQSEKDEPYLKDDLSNSYREEQNNDETNHFHRIDIGDIQDDHIHFVNSPTAKHNSGLSHMFTCWFPYNKLSSSKMGKEKCNSSKYPVSKSGSLKNIIRFYNSNKSYCRRESKTRK